MPNNTNLIPDGWKMTTLGEIAKKIEYGYTESSTLEKIGPKFLRITDIQDDFINWNTVPYCPISEKDHLKYKLEIGDVVIARTGNSTGATATIKQDIDAIFASYLIRFKINPEIADYYFIDFLLRSKLWKGFVGSVKGGSAQGGANAKDFSIFPILLPPLPEQRAIAAVLSSFDDKIELLREQNKTLEETAQTIFKEWFVKFKFPGATGKMIDSELGEIPEGWRVGRLGEEVDISIGRTPPRGESEWFSNDPIGKKWISIKDIGNSELYISNTSEYLTDEAVEKFKIPIIPENTTILSFKMTVGKLAITTEKMLSNEAIAHLKIKDNSNVTSEFIYSSLLELDFNSLGSTSSIVTAINSTMIKVIEILVPDKKIMQKFNLVIQPIFSKLKTNNFHITTLSKLRDLILPKLMKGELRVTRFIN